MEYAWVSLENLQKATEHFERCLPLARDFWQQNPADPIRKSLLAANYKGLALVEEVSREPDQALNNFRTSLEILGSDLNDDEDHDMNVATLYNLMGAQLDHLGAQAEAFVNYQRAIAIAEALATQRSSSKRAKRLLLLAYSEMIGPLAGEQTLNVGDSSQAQTYARKVLTIAEGMAASDSKDADARSLLGFAYFDMGNAFRLTQPATAAAWYRKSILLAKELSPPSEAKHHIATRQESLAAVLVKKEQTAERLHLLLEANALRQNLASTEPDLPMHRQNMMRSYCKLSDAELAVHDIAKARQYADLSLPLVKTFPLASPDLRILRDVGFCYESLGNVQSQVAQARAFSLSQRSAATAESTGWYRKSLEVWEEWRRRGAATPESELERRKIEGLLENNRQREASATLSDSSDSHSSTAMIEAHSLLRN